jgi:hypothetical protein
MLLEDDICLQNQSEEGASIAVVNEASSKIIKNKKKTLKKKNNTPIFLYVNIHMCVIIYSIQFWLNVRMQR